jgi:hypothetical protein
MNTYITIAAFVALQAMVQDPSLSQNEEDAAAIAIQAYRTSTPVDHHVASVLQGYVVRTGFTQDRYGK